MFDLHLKIIIWNIKQLIDDSQFKMWFDQGFNDLHDEQGGA